MAWRKVLLLATLLAASLAGIADAQCTISSVALSSTYDVVGRLIETDQGGDITLTLNVDDTFETLVVTFPNYHLDCASRTITDDFGGGSWACDANGPTVTWTGSVATGTYNIDFSGFIRNPSFLTTSTFTIDVNAGADTCQDTSLTHTTTDTVVYPHDQMIYVLPVSSEESVTTNIAVGFVTTASLSAGDEITVTFDSASYSANAGESANLGEVSGVTVRGITKPFAATIALSGGDTTTVTIQESIPANTWISFEVDGWDTTTTDPAALSTTLTAGPNGAPTTRFYNIPAPTLEASADLMSGSLAFSDTAPGWDGGSTGGVLVTVDVDGFTMDASSFLHIIFPDGFDIRDTQSTRTINDQDASDVSGDFLTADVVESDQYRNWLTLAPTGTRDAGTFDIERVFLPLDAGATDNILLIVNVFGSGPVQMLSVSGPTVSTEVNQLEFVNPGTSGVDRIRVSMFLPYTISNGDSCSFTFPAGFTVGTPSATLGSVPYALSPPDTDTTLSSSGQNVTLVAGAAGFASSTQHVFDIDGVTNPGTQGRTDPIFFECAGVSSWRLALEGPVVSSGLWGSVSPADLRQGMVSTLTVSVSFPTDVQIGEVIGLVFPSRWTLGTPSATLGVGTLNIDAGCTVSYNGQVALITVVNSAVTGGANVVFQLDNIGLPIVGAAFASAGDIEVYTIPYDNTVASDHRGFLSSPNVGPYAVEVTLDDHKADANDSSILVKFYTVDSITVDDSVNVTLQTNEEYSLFVNRAFQYTLDEVPQYMIKGFEGIEEYVEIRSPASDIITEHEIQIRLRTGAGTIPANTEIILRLPHVSVNRTNAFAQDSNLTNTFTIKSAAWSQQLSGIPGDYAYRTMGWEVGLDSTQHGNTTTAHVSFRPYRNYATNDVLWIEFPNGFYLNSSEDSDIEYIKPNVAKYTLPGALASGTLRTLTLSDVILPSTEVGAWSVFMHTSLGDSVYAHGANLTGTAPSVAFDAGENYPNFASSSFTVTAASLAPMQAGDHIIVELPSGFSVTISDGETLGANAVSGVVAGDSIELITGTRRIKVTLTGTLSEGDDVVFKVGGYTTNPPARGSSGDFRVVFTSANFGTRVYNYVPQVDVEHALTLDNYANGRSDVTATFSFYVTQPIAGGDSVTLTFPSEYTGLLSTTYTTTWTCGGPQVASMTISGLVGTVTVPGACAIDDTTAVFTISSLDNPAWGLNPGTTGNFVLTLASETIMFKGLTFTDLVNVEVLDLTPASSGVIRVTVMFEADWENGDTLEVEVPTGFSVSAPSADLGAVGGYWFNNGDDPANYDLSTSGSTILVLTNNGATVSAGTYTFDADGVTTPGTSGPTGTFTITVKDTSATTEYVFTNLLGTIIYDGYVTLGNPTNGYYHDVDGLDEPIAITVTSQSTLFVDESFVITFPEGFVLNAPSGSILFDIREPTGSLHRLSTVSYDAINRQVTITVKFTDWPSRTTATFYLDGITNPTKSAGESCGDLTLSESGLTYYIQGDTLERTMAVAPDSLDLGALTYVRVTVEPSQELLNEDYIEVTFPSGFVVEPTMATLAESDSIRGFARPQECNVYHTAGSSVVRVVVRGQQSAIAAGTTLVFEIDGVRNPFIAGATDTFSVTFGHFPNAPDPLSVIPGVTINAGVVPGFNAGNNKQVTGQKPGLTVSFVPVDGLSNGDLIWIQLPNGNEPHSYKIITPDISSISGIGAGSIVTKVDSLNMYVTVAGNVAAGTAVKFVISDVGNPSTAGITGRPMLRLTSSEGSVGAVPPVNIEGALSVSPANSRNGQSCGAITVSFVAGTALTGANNIAIVFPDEYIVGTPTPTGTISGTTLPAGLDATSTYSTNAQTVTVDLGGATSIAAGDLVSFDIDGVTNPSLNDLDTGGTFNIVPDSGDPFMFVPAVQLTEILRSNSTRRDLGQTCGSIEFWFMASNGWNNGETVQFVFPGWGMPAAVNTDMSNTADGYGFTSTVNDASLFTVAITKPGDDVLVTITNGDVAIGANTAIQLSIGQDITLPRVAGQSDDLQIDFSGASDDYLYITGPVVKAGMVPTVQTTAFGSGNFRVSWEASSQLVVGETVELRFPNVTSGGTAFPFTIDDATVGIVPGGSLNNESTLSFDGSGNHIVTIQIAGSPLPQGVVWFDLSGIRNPAWAGESGSFSITPSQGLAPSSPRGVVISGDLAVTPNSDQAGLYFQGANANDFVRVQFEADAAGASGETIAITFPTGYRIVDIGGAPTLTSLGQALVNIDGASTLSWDTVNNVVTVTLAGGGVSAAGLVDFYIHGVRAPFTTGRTDYYQIDPSWHGDDNRPFSYVARRDVTGTLGVSHAFSRLGQEVGLLTVQFQQGAVGLADTEEIYILMPSGTHGYTVPDGAMTLDAATSAGIGSCEGNSTEQAITCTVDSDTVAAFEDVSIVFDAGQGVLAPLLAGTTSDFSITFPLNDATVDAFEYIPGVTIDAGVLPAVQYTGQSSGDLTISFVATEAIAAGDTIVVNFPTDRDTYYLGSATLQAIPSYNFDATMASFELSGTDSEVLTITTGATINADSVRITLSGVVNPSQDETTPNPTGTFDIIPSTGASYTNIYGVPITGTLSITSNSAFVGHLLEPLFGVAAEATDVVEVNVVPSALLEYAVSDTLAVVFPSEFQVEDRLSATLASVCSPDCVTVGIDASSVFVASSATNTVTVTVRTADIAANSQVTFWVAGVRMPSTSGDSSRLTIIPKQGDSFTRVQPVSITGTLSVVPDTLNTGSGLSDGESGKVTVQFVPSQDIGNSEGILVTFPEGFNIYNAAWPTQSPTPGSGSWDTPTVATSGQTINITLGGSGSISADTLVSFQLSGIQNPVTSGTTGTFSIKQLDSSGGVIGDTYSTVSGVTISGDLSVVASNSYVNMPTESVTVKFVPSAAIPPGGFIAVTFPSEITLSSGAALEDGATNLDDTSTIIVDTGNNRVIVTVGTTAVAADTQVSFTISGGMTNSGNPGVTGTFTVTPSTSDYFSNIPGLTLLAPTVSSVTPDNGALAGGTTVTITGGGLHNSDITYVSFNGRAIAIPGDIIDQTQSGMLVVQTPDATSGRTAVGLGDIVIVSASLGTTTLTDGWRYNSACCWRQAHTTCTIPPNEDPSCENVESDIYGQAV